MCVCVGVCVCECVCVCVNVCVWCVCVNLLDLVPINIDVQNVFNCDPHI